MSKSSPSLFQGSLIRSVSPVFRRRLLAAAGCTLALCVQASAEPAPAASPVADHEVLVPGTRLQPAPFEPAASVSIITAARIATSPARTVAELLALEAGVHVRSLYGNRSVRATVDLRGFGVTGGQNTLILLDGRRLNDVDLASVNFAALPLHNIERIEIVRGAGSVLYGDGASGGTVNVVTRRPRAGEFSATAAAAGGSHDTRGLEGRLSWGASRASVNLAAENLESDGYRDNNALKQRNGQVELRLERAGTDFYLKTGLSDQHLGLPGVRTVDPGAALDELGADPRGTLSPDDYAAERAGYLTLGFNRRLGTAAGLLFDAGYRERGQQAWFASFSDYLDTDLRTLSLTPRLYVDHDLPLLPGRLIAGIDFYDHDYDSRRAFTRQTIARPIHRLLLDQRNTAVYASHFAQPTARLSVELGARLQRVRLRARDLFDPAAPGAAEKFEFSGAPDFSRVDTESMFEAGFGYALTQSSRVYLRASRSVRFGTVDELYEYDAFFARVFSPLEPQVARQVEIGARHGRGAFQGRLAAYGMDLREEIHFNPLTFANENLDPTRRRGIEAEVSVQAAANLALRATYTLQRAEFRDGPFDGNEVPVAPRRLAGLSALWSMLPNVQLAANWRYVGEKRFDNDETNTFSARIPAYDLLDARLTVSHMAGDRLWTVSVAAHNLLDERAFDYGVASTFTPGRFNAYPLPERGYTLRLALQFD
jgi:iron complex outermembrane receptor protein